MLKRMVGLAGITVWAGAIVFLSLFGEFAGAEPLLERLGDDWTVESTVEVERGQLAEMSRKLGGRLKSVTNSVVSREGEQIQVNVVECPTPIVAAKVAKNILDMKADPAFCVLADKTVVEYVGSDAELAKQITDELFEPEERLDPVAKKLVTEVPEGWDVYSSFMASREETKGFGEKLGARIRGVSNTVFTFDGEAVQVNTIDCMTEADADKVEQAMVGLKPSDEYVVRDGKIVGEIVTDDDELARMVAAVLGGDVDAEAEPSESAMDIATGWVDMLTSGEYAAAQGRFDENMKVAMNAEQLRGAWEGVEAAMGDFVGQQAVRTSQEAGLDVVYVTCEFEKGLLDVKLVFDNDTHISGLWFTESQG